MEIVAPRILIYKVESAGVLYISKRNFNVSNIVYIFFLIRMGIIRFCLF